MELYPVLSENNVSLAIDFIQRTAKAMADKEISIT